ncbi:hypothetical protein [Reichenbachiella sp.]|uniref:hypothetical protein n=1 Tax=Reichenbachiella sp. TaxID=2184521 RepID=UPI003BAE4901
MNIRKELVVAATGTVIIFLMAYQEVSPLEELMNWGAKIKSRQADTTLSQTYSTYTEAKMTGSKLLLDVKRGAHFWHPQVVVWVEDTSGIFIKTLFITESSAKGLFMSGRTADNFKSFDDPKSESRISKNELRLVDALPYWSHKRDRETHPGFYAPTFDQPETDGMTGATPQGNFYIRSHLPDSLYEFNIYLEVNVAFDDNEYYSEYDFPEDSLYHGGTGLLGQPSLIYQATWSRVDDHAFKLMQLLGHSHHSGQNGKLYTDLSNITTAQKIIDRVVVGFERSD